MGGGIARDQRGTDLAREKTVLPDIDRADAGPLGIRQDRQADCAGDVILGIFRGRAHVDDLIKGQDGELWKAAETDGHGRDFAKSMRLPCPPRAPGARGRGGRHPRHDARLTSPGFP
jgi:hypothetical protein